MSSRMGTHHEIIELTDALTENSISQSQLKRLDELLLSDIYSCQTYVEYIDLQLWLTNAKRDREVILDREEYRRKTERGPFQRRMLIASSVCSSILMLTIVVGFFAAYYFHQPVVAVVQSSSDRVASSNEALRDGAPLRRGQTIAFDNGMVTVMMESGATLLLRGPTKFVVQDENEIFLLSGVMKAHVPQEAIGFRVTTMNLQVEDWGTEFVVDATDAKYSRVDLQQGRCGVRAAVEGKPFGNFRELLPGMAYQWPETGPVELLQPSKIEHVDFHWRPNPFENVELKEAGIIENEGSFYFHNTSPRVLDPFQRTRQTYAQLFLESEGVVLEEDLVLSHQGESVTVPAGTTVRSFLLQYAPNQDTGSTTTGSLLFEHPILAVISNHRSLLKTDELFSPSDFKIFREIGFGRGCETDGQDRVVIESDRRKLSYRFYVSSSPKGGMDQVRVLVLDNPATPKS
ncbi:FecR family protein [Calycomorphotria hydatis]|uniref:FecR protein n=1 Tax=Calycomorphotria hydatis TaxID=2528027 RepID=A0A517T4P9_9PLAN|nr:FecR domain-containing protein [Calycomorphotria hydatis]QDT63321.1 FecR protein [Calycomorphotria hydatis]